MLYEREEHISQLSELIARCQDGEGRAALITGPVASGKTALLNAFTERAARAGAKFLNASGSPSEQDLPLGVLSELMRAAGLPALPAGEAIPGQRLSAPVVLELCRPLLDLADSLEAPLVICVDDAHHADAASWQCLLFLVRRLRSAKVLVVFTESAGVVSRLPLPRAELLRDGRCRHLRLDMLSARGVGAALAAELPVAFARRFAADAHAFTGGNPLLLRGLLDDNHASRGSGVDELDEVRVGACYREAVLACLCRGEPVLFDVARGVAVLPEGTDPAELVGVEPEVAARALQSLNVIGILGNGRFRHPEGSAAVLRSIDEPSGRALYLRAAASLNAKRASAGVVARYLLNAGAAEDTWAISALHETAEQALVDGDVDLALDCLQLVLRSDADEWQRAATAAMLARVEWRSNPAGAMRHVDAVTAAVRGGFLDARHAFAPVNWLLWFGHDDAAREVLGELDRSSAQLSPHAAARLRSLRTLSEYLYPPPSGVSADVRPAGEDSVSANLWLHATSLLEGVFAGGAGVRVIAGAEQVLRVSRLDERTLMPNVVSLITLILTERLPSADFWCELLVGEATEAHEQTWRGLFSALRAEIAIRRGDLRLAETSARTALTAVPGRSWGVGIGIAMGVLLQASTALGSLDAAAELMQAPVPEAMYRTPFGLGYLRARGLYHHAAGRFDAAFEEFQLVGRLMTKWAMDLPALVPWRTDAAKALLCLGQVSRAHALAAEQLRLCCPAGTGSRAVSLRVLAATSELAERPALLNKAVDALQGYDERLEFAHALTDLGRTHQALGDAGRARVMLDRAQHIARQCGITGGITGALDRSPEFERHGPDFAEEPWPGLPAESAVDELSDAERRVAVLVARRLTNRQIAGKLFITVSTVEQHLTQIYRKLKVKSRVELHGADVLSA
ncbi:AAA family ATPase [Amycolatopsis sp. NPDC088138]|uniref:helix-turn-helix transcriptional regulator n=1 Tax=Amycolatopsis sp. NPDC088138 TaxID=3363938 RepID=UPI00382D5C97